MASKRRGGFRAPELRGTLGTLLRTTTGVVRDALERGAREGRARLDGARASRRRHDALADLGELVLDLIRRGEIDLAELPEARDLVRELDDLDDDTATADPAARTDAEPDLPPRPSTRRRFDDRGGRDDRNDRRDDGTVSSGATARAARSDRSERYTIPDRPRSSDTSSSRASTRPMKGALRATFDDPSSSSDHRTRIERWDATRTDRIGRPGRFDHTAPADRERERSERTGERDRADRADRSPASDRERERSDQRTAPNERAHRERTSPDHDGLDHHDHPDPRDAADHRSHPNHRDHAGHRDHSDHRDHPDEHDHVEHRDTSGHSDRADHRDSLGHKAPQAHRASNDRDRPDHRDSADHGGHGGRLDHRETEPLDRPTGRSPLPRDPTRKGGISFDDEDLADYMHPDDVPAKPSSKPPPPDPDDHDA